MSPSKQEENVEEEQAFLPPAPPRRDTAWSQDGRPGKVTPYLRLAMEIAMAAIIIVLLVSPVYERIGPERSPVPRCMSPPILR